MDLTDLKNLRRRMRVACDRRRSESGKNFEFWGGGGSGGDGRRNTENYKGKCGVQASMSEGVNVNVKAVVLGIPPVQGAGD